MRRSDEVVSRVWRTAQHPDPVADDGRRVDYVDTFVVELRDDDAHAGLTWLHAGLLGAPPLVRGVVGTAWRVGLRLRLAPGRAPGHVAGWRVVVDEPGTARLEADGPLGSGVLLARADGPRLRTLSTALTWHRPAAARVWSVVGIAHRFLAPRMMVAAARRLSDAQVK